GVSLYLKEVGNMYIKGKEIGIGIGIEIEIEMRYGSGFVAVEKARSHTM
ncbi:hypothetical protein A2U01_0023976, partial [Trifolium medium]|nr:hypothetical protein [Trifolium medium]